MMFPIKAESIVLTRNGVKILDELSVEIKEGSDITIVLGFNGAGKSALMRVFTGLIQPDSGKLIFGGLDVLPEKIRDFQTLILQKPVMFRRSVGENIKYGLRQFKKLADRRERFEELLELCEIAHLVNRPARNVSIGEQQRISLARALALNPKIIYMDEPTSSLDPVSVQIMEDVIRAESAGGRKIILVTHSVEQARRLATDVIFIHRGRVVEHREAADFFEGPRSEVAQAFINGSVRAEHKKELVDD